MTLLISVLLLPQLSALHCWDAHTIDYTFYSLVQSVFTKFHFLSTLVYAIMLIRSLNII